MKILTVIGARPQFIKAAAVSRAIAKHNESTNDQRSTINEIIVHTGQHYDANMSDIFFEQMAIPKPDYHLGVGGGPHGQMTGRQLEKIEEVLLKEKPDWVLVYGDTNSTLAGALAASKLHIPVAHIEAGLRSFNRRMPEEINRVLTDHVSSMLFCPTETAVNNLIKEGFDVTRDQRPAASNHPIVFNVGDVMYDAALFYRDRAVKPIWFDSIGVGLNEFVLCTIHRAENTDNEKKLNAIFKGLADSGVSIVFPLHPRTREKIKQYQIEISNNIHLVEPVGYLEMVWMEINCKLIATDSGGMQKEAYFHKKQCMVLREQTEWVELIEIGANTLVSADPSKIRQAINCSDSNNSAYLNEIYGNGSSSQAIVGIISKNDKLG